MIILDGNKLASKIREKIKLQIKDLKKNNNVVPGLATILVGANPASEVYVNIKHKACAEVGIDSRIIRLPETIPMNELIQQIDTLNSDDTIHGILVQLPLPEHLDPLQVMDKISPNKDVDGFNPINSGNILNGIETFIPCTPKGILSIFAEYDISLEKKDVVIINHSVIVGKPLALLLLNRNATVSVCHIHTQDIVKYTRNADILIIGVGKPNFLKKEMVKQGSIVIDVGINRIDGKICGDVDFDDVKGKVHSITPVPGGVGPMTVASLLENTLSAYDKLIIM